MGTFYVTLRVADRFRERYANIDALVDTGSTHTSLPESLLDELGIERERVRRFELADNRIIEYPVGETRVVLEGVERTVPVMFAPDDEMPLVGAVTLHTLGLGVAADGERLFPVVALRKLPRLEVVYGG